MWESPASWLGEQGCQGARKRTWCKGGGARRRPLGSAAERLVIAGGGRGWRGGPSGFGRQPRGRTPRKRRRFELSGEWRVYEVRVCVCVCVCAREVHSYFCTIDRACGASSRKLPRNDVANSAAHARFPRAPRPGAREPTARTYGGGGCPLHPAKTLFARMGARARGGARLPQSCLGKPKVEGDEEKEEEKGKMEKRKKEKRRKRPD
ncbi:Protein of unknown function [Gryllus bimaculatus]|nr:Protein of unknown function [Gryllus bimaculatus]